MRITVLSIFGRAWALASVLLIATLVVPLAAFATDVAPQPEGPVVTGVNIWLVLLGGVSPLVGYVFNHYLPHTNVQLKGVVQTVIAAGVAVFYTAVSSGAGIDNKTLVAVVTAMGAALLAHFGYRASAINVLFGGGTNASGMPDTIKVIGGATVVAPHAQPAVAPIH
jgi:hypothetical protein